MIKCLGHGFAAVKISYLEFVVFLGRRMIVIPKIGHEKDYTSQRFNSFAGNYYETRHNV